MTRPAIATAAACCLLLVAGMSFAAETTWRHALRLADGSVHGRRLFYSQKMLVGVASLNGEIKRTVTIDLTIRKGGEEPGGGAIVSVTYDFLHYSEDGITGRSSYSSREGGPVPQVIRELAPLVGRSFRIMTDREGTITAIQNADEASAAAILALFPRAPVAPGTSWPWNLTFPGQTPTLLTSTLTLKGVNATAATLAIRSVLKPGPTTGTTSGDGLVTLGLGVSGTQEGEFDVDRSTGLPVKGSVRQHFSGTVRLGTGSRLPLPSGQLSVPMTGEGLLTLSSY